jgi:hypothetical protein
LVKRLKVAFDNRPKSESARLVDHVRYFDAFIAVRLVETSDLLSAARARSDLAPGD